jgi:hypothetical protein
VVLDRYAGSWFIVGSSLVGYDAQNVRDEERSVEQQQSRWRPSRRQVLWASGIVASLTVAVLIGYRYGITLWDWIKLLIVPAVIAGGGLWFNAQQREREQQIAHERAQDEALQAYLDGMSQLLTDKDRPLHRSQRGDSLSTVARARTLTVLARLDPVRKGSVMQFLYESGLITRERVVLELSGADLSGADLSGANLNLADLSGANLIGANLRETNLMGADLLGANLNSATLVAANLYQAYLLEASLFQANLKHANLIGAILRTAFMFKSDLSDADLRGADLTGAMELTEEQLPDWRLLTGATMPNGQKYEDWLKSTGRGEDGENTGTS